MDGSLCFARESKDFGADTTQGASAPAAHGPGDRAPVGLSSRDQLGSGHTLFIPRFLGRKASSAAICQPPGPLGYNGSWGKHLAHLPWANNIVQIFCRRQLSFLVPPDAWRTFCSFCLYCTCWFLRGVSEGRTCHPTRYCFLCTSASSERIGMLVLLKTLENGLLKENYWMNQLLLTCYRSLDLFLKIS